MSEQDKAEAERRMLEVLLAEEFEADASVAAAPRERERWRSLLPIAACVLLGVGVVSMLMLRGRDGDLATANTLAAQFAAANAQDPKKPKPVVPKDLSSFLAHMKEAQEVHLLTRRVVGAAQVRDDEGGSDDQLISVVGLRHPIKGELFAKWCDGIRASAKTKQVSNHLDDVYVLEFQLSGDRRMSCFCSWSDTNPQIWLTSNYAITPNKDLRELFRKSTVVVRLGQRLKKSVVKDVEELNSLSIATTRLELTREVAIAAETPDCFRSIERLVLGGGTDEQAFSVTARMPKLRRLELRSWQFYDEAVAWILRLPNLESLVLRDCSGLTADAVRTLGQLRSLRKLHCINTIPGGDSLDLSTLASLPVLEEFGLRSKFSLTTENIASLLRTKVSRLWLVDVDVEGDLATLARLPSLREMMLAVPMRDAQLERIAAIKSLRRLIVRNAKANGGFIDTIKRELPKCQIDWTLNSRWFDTSYAFEYVDGLPPLTK